MKILTIWSVCLTVLPLTDMGKGPLHKQCSVIIRPAARIQFPGIVHGTTDPKAAGDVDCSSPAHWDGDTIYMFYSTGHPFRSSGSNLFGLSQPSRRVSFDNETGWKMGGRWIESTYKAEDGKLYMWYHNEPPLSPNRTAPRIGTMVSGDNGLTWRDLGIVLEAPRGSNNPDSANKYFVGGNGDFAVIADRKEKYFYFFISTYHRDKSEQGVAVARMAFQDLAQPNGKVFKWHKGRWTEPGIGGHVTTIFPVNVDWHRADADAFWGPSIHWNTYLNAWVMLLNRAKDKNWAQEGIYISFNRSLSEPSGWTKPVKILDAGELEKSKWYPQVIGTNANKRETDKLAGGTARLFVAGLSKWEIEFQKPGAISADGEPQQTDLFISGQDGYKAYRIPALSAGVLSLFRTSQHFFAFEIGFDPASPEATPRQVGFVLGLFWHYIGFNWVCIGFDWLCIGFVFPASAKCLIFIIHCYNMTYVHLTFLEIGFVLHKKS